ncbi:MAG: LacI family DNA-binding transcriptional regulator [Chloroflexi bacterium]|nr:LacI family DNA-binding transcriptional regulator [Chloroflexota bacterium]
MDSQEEKITILDIARKANVSPSTVSRVLRGSARVNPSKHNAVMQAVAELDYRPNVFAQSLASGQSMTIGVVTQNFGSPFYDAILLGILQGLEQTPYSPIFADGRWQLAVEKRSVNMLLDRRVDGIILIGGLFPDMQLEKIAAQKPVILVARTSATLPDQCIQVDNFKGAYAATKHLIDMGHRNIAHITALDRSHVAIEDVTQRFEGYKQALADADIEFAPDLVVEGDLQQQSGVLAVERLLLQKRPFSAIFAANDQIAFGVRLGLFRRGLRVPEDISLIGFDDQITAAYTIPPLTTVHQPAIELGHAAAAGILNLINGKSASTPMFEPKLMIRESVARIR